MTEHAARRVLQMRLVVHTDDYDAALAFYRDALGAPDELTVHGDDGEKVTILDVGRATLELSNSAQVDLIDRVEVGRRVSPRLRVAFEVADVFVFLAQRGINPLICASGSQSSCARSSHISGIRTNPGSELFPLRLLVHEADKEIL